MLGQFSPAKAK